MSNKAVVFVTGSNTGLGYEAVKALYKSPNAYEIIIGSRSEQKGKDAISALEKEVPKSSSTLSTVSVDLESDDSIQQAYDTISKKFGKLDALVNNAGGNWEHEVRDGKISVRQGFNRNWDVNVAGTQVLTDTFMPILLKGTNPRLLFVTSGTSTLAETERFDNEAMKRINSSPAAGWPKEKSPNPITAYRSAKCGLNMLMREWYRILKNDGVKVWAISPGFLATSLNNVGAEKLKQIGALDPSVGGEFIKDVVEGKRDQDVGKVIRSDMIQPW